MITDASAWQEWWDQLEQIAQNFGIPKSKITGHRTERERRIDARVRDILTSYPDAPTHIHGSAEVGGLVEVVATHTGVIKRADASIGRRPRFGERMSRLCQTVQSTS